MNGTIYLLDFRNGTVEAIDEAIPPRGVHFAGSGTEPEPLPEGAGFVLTSLGTPPERDEE